MSDPWDGPPRAALEGAPTLEEKSGEALVASADTLVGVPSQAEPQGPIRRAAASAADHIADPARIGRYLIIRRLGQGGMGIVYSAYDADLDRKVAVKVVRNRQMPSSMGRARVLREAQAMARIAHPNVVHVYEVGQDEASPDGQIFIAMEFVAGLSLQQRQQQHRGKIPFQDLIRPYLQAAAGLEAAHRSGLIHRDFKPDNVLVGDDGRARVVDFGLARALDESSKQEVAPTEKPERGGLAERLTQAGTILGTPGYMAPEQVLGQEADARSDQFSFCAALYEALYQQLPFAGNTFEEFSTNVLAGNIRPAPRQDAASLDVPFLLDQVLRRGLSRDPAARFPSMQALIAAIESSLHPDSDSQRTRRVRQRVVVGVLTVLAVVSLLRLLAIQNPTLTNLRSAMALGWVTFGIALGAILLHRKELTQHTTHRKVAYFGFVWASFVTLTRTFGFLAKVPATQYLLIETLTFGALFALEIPNAGKRYGWLVALCILSAILQLLVPAYSRHIVIALNPTLLILAVALRKWAVKSN